MDIEKLLKLTYEIEGLLYLLKEEGITQEKRVMVQSHIDDKIAQLSGLSSCAEIPTIVDDKPISSAISDGTKTDDEETFMHSSFIHDEIPAFEEIRHGNILQREIADETAEIEGEMSESYENIPEHRIYDEVEDESEEVMSEAETQTPAESSEETAADNKAIAANALYEEEEDADGEPAADLHPEHEIEKELKQRIEAETVTKSQPETEKRQDVNIMAYRRNMGESLRSSFTLNDKFRFRRELFGNSDIEMSNAINLIEAMSSPDEAEEYFIGELGWDKTNDEVKDFMEIIDNYLSGK